MKQGIGMSVTINIIAIFIVITFAFLIMTLNYYKSYKVNNYVSESIEKYEGYNDLAIKDIDKKLDILGYVRNNKNCPTRPKGYGQNLTSDTSYCVYEKKDSSTNTKKYTVITYLNMQIPIINQVLNLPVKTTTKAIYNFSE